MPTPVIRGGREMSAQARPQVAYRGQAQQRQGDARGRVERRGQAHRTHGGRGSIQSGTSIPGGEAVVWLPEGALQGAAQEHRSDTHAVRAIESVDGATNVACLCRGGAPVRRKIEVVRGKSALRRRRATTKSTLSS